MTSRSQHLIRMRPLDGRLTVAERATYVESFLACAATKKNADDIACARIAVLLGREISLDSKIMRVALEDAQRSCRRCQHACTRLLALF